MIKFHLPDFYYFYDINMFFADNIKNNPDKFIDDISIGSFYGSFPGMNWNGGRCCQGITDKGNITNTINSINSCGIPVRFTLTNVLIDEHLLYDPYCNMILEIAHNGKNEILVNNKMLEEYLRNKYPNFKYISSTTKCIMDIDKFNEELENYYLVVLDYRKNTDKDFLKAIKHKDKTEILINAYCSPTCNKREEHYKYLSQCQLDQEPINCSFCNTLSHSFQESLKLDSVIKVDNLYNYYVKQGFTNFKIEGRTLHPIDVIDSYVYYMVKPEYRDEIRNEVVKTFWNFWR